MSTLPSHLGREFSEMEQSEGIELPPVQTPPTIEQAREAFQRALPRLLQERLGQWVAYHGDTLLGFGQTKQDLYQKCLRQYRRGEFLVRAIRPPPEKITIGLR